jgi:hypothetical protein
VLARVLPVQAAETGCQNGRDIPRWTMVAGQGSRPGSQKTGKIFVFPIFLVGRSLLGTRLALTEKQRIQLPNPHLATPSLGRRHSWRSKWSLTTMPVSRCCKAFRNSPVL